ncbi:hypothetical protein KIW84_042330 [Lathyrus oleraceus]|uniref:Uncharacterized protein n=1 Tax=Pisum sativum TaxID=3888 RepID=A0A9D4XAS4_PEA|nr:hypothetical protein KIW84_042330 [Pisum sativum]
MTYSSPQELILIDKVKERVDIHASSSTCNKCRSLETKIVDLNQIIYKYEKGKNVLDNILSNQRYVNDKSSLGFSKIKNSSQIEKIMSNITILVTMFNLKKYVIICNIERHIKRITYLIIKKCLT